MPVFFSRREHAHRHRVAGTIARRREARLNLSHTARFTQFVTEISIITPVGRLAQTIRELGGSAFIGRKPVRSARCRTGQQ